jgi:hypothetical protein
VSLRSLKDEDTTPISLAYGGGGKFGSFSNSLLLTLRSITKVTRTQVRFQFRLTNSIRGKRRNELLFRDGSNKHLQDPVRSFLAFNILRSIHTRVFTPV